MNRPASTPAPRLDQIGRISITSDGAICCTGAWTLDYLAELERQTVRLPKTLTGPIHRDVIGETACASGSLFAHANRMRWRVLLYNHQVDGLNALPIVGLLSFLMGIVIAYQGAEQLKSYGKTSY